MTETLLTPEEAANRFGSHVSAWWVRRELQAGRLRGSKIGRRWFVPESAITDRVEATSNVAARRRRRRAAPS